MYHPQSIDPDFLALGSLPKLHPKPSSKSFWSKASKSLEARRSRKSGSPKRECQYLVAQEKITYFFPWSGL